MDVKHYYSIETFVVYSTLPRREFDKTLQKRNSRHVFQQNAWVCRLQKTISDGHLSDGIIITVEETFKIEDLDSEDIDLLPVHHASRLESSDGNDINGT